MFFIEFTMDRFLLDMGVNFGRIDARMSQKHLNASEVGSSFKQMRRECVAQFVWRNILGDSCQHGKFL